MDDSQQLLSNIYSLSDWATWKDSLDQAEAGIRAWLNRVNAGRFSRIYLVGCGSSYYAGQVGKHIFEHLLHLPVEARQAFSFTQFADPRMLSGEILVIGISSTGNTAATCSALAFARQHGAATLAVTAAPDSKVTTIAENTIFMGGGDTVLVKTRSYIQSLLALYWLALEFAEHLDRLPPEAKGYWQDQMRTAHALTQSFLQNQPAKITEWVDEYRSAANIFVLGSGPNAGTAEEAALKVIEMAKLYADGCDMEDFFHGRDRQLAPGSHIFFLAPQNAARERMLDFLTFTRKVAAPTVVLTCRDIPELSRLANHTLLLPGTLDELATPLVYITPIYLFNYQLAIKRGFDPIARRFPMGALSVQYKGSEFDKTD